MTSVINDVEELSREASRRVMNLTLRQGQPWLVVDSPPGAGKTRLIEDLSALAVLHPDLRMRVGIVAQQQEQVYDLVRRLLAGYPDVPVQMLSSAARLILPADLEAEVQSGRMRPTTNRVFELMNGSGVIVGTAAKLALSRNDFGQNYFDLLICDEAYQLRFADYAPLQDIARQTVLVGDPGQLPPQNRLEIERFEVARYRVHWAVPQELRRRYGSQIPVVRLPATRRLPQDTVELIQPAFYPDLQFVSLADDDDRRLVFDVAGMTAIDRALNMMAIGVSVVGILLPQLENPLLGPDQALCALQAEVAERLLLRGARWRGLSLQARNIGCADSHVNSVSETRRQLRLRGSSLGDIRVDTPEQWQGLERPVMVVKHPLSGDLEVGSFNLQPGRWCVMLSRHQVGCIIVGRDGIGEQLERYSHDCSERSFGAKDETWAGWNAHRLLWDRLEELGRIVRIGNNV